MHALNKNIMRNIRMKSLQEQEKQILFGLLMLCISLQKLIAYL